jgi:hypothetical protein
LALLVFETFAAGGSRFTLPSTGARAFLFAIALVLLVCWFGRNDRSLAKGNGLVSCMRNVKGENNRA